MPLGSNTAPGDDNKKAMCSMVVNLLCCKSLHGSPALLFERKLCWAMVEAA